MGTHGLHPVLADPTPRRPIQQQQSSWVSASLPEGKGSFFCALPGGSCPQGTASAGPGQEPGNLQEALAPARAEESQGSLAICAS